MREIDHTSFAEEVQAAGPDLSPARAGLLFAREIAYPDLRPSDYLTRLEALATHAAEVLAPHATSAARGLALADWLFRSGAFRGDEHNYTDPRNAYLNDVLDRHLGLPISLSVIYLEIGQRLNLPVAGVGLPGHFIVSVLGDAGPVYLDPFHQSQTLTQADCRRLVETASGHTGRFDPRWLQPTPAPQIVARMLSNLRNFYMRVEDWPLAVTTVEKLHALQPEVVTHLRDLGILLYRAGYPSRATHYLDQYLALHPHAEDGEVVRQSRDRLVEHLVRLN